MVVTHDDAREGAARADRSALDGVEDAALHAQRALNHERIACAGPRGLVRLQRASALKRHRGLSLTKVRPLNVDTPQPQAVALLARDGGGLSQAQGRLIGTTPDHGQARRERGGDVETSSAQDHRQRLVVRYDVGD